MTLNEEMHGAILSLLDVVEELCAGIASDQKPEQDWVDVVTSTFQEHRDGMRFAGLS